MRFPKPGEGAHTILTTIREHGPMTVDQGIAKHGQIYCKKYLLPKTYTTCVVDGWLVRDGEIYSLSDAAKTALNGEKPVMPRVVMAKPEGLPGPYHPKTPEMKMKTSAYLQGFRTYRIGEEPTPERQHYTLNSSNKIHFRGVELKETEVKVKEEQQ